MNEKTTQGSISLCAILTIAFTALKLTGCIDWPWLYVLAPLLIETAVAIFVIAVLFVIILTKGGRNG